MTFKANVSQVCCNGSCCQVTTYFTLLFHFFHPFFFYYFFCPHLFYEKRILGLNKFIKFCTNSLFVSVRKGFVEVIPLNQVMVTLQNYEHLLYWKCLKGKSFCISKSLTGKLYFRKVWCHFCNLVQRGETIHCLQMHS